MVKLKIDEGILVEGEEPTPLKGDDCALIIREDLTTEIIMSNKDEEEELSESETLLLSLIFALQDPDMVEKLRSFVIEFMDEENSKDHLKMLN